MSHAAPLLRAAVAPLPVTVALLTWNEEANLGRTLASLGWAQRVVIVDSGSTDATETIARGFFNVSWHARRFDDFGGQWTHAFRQTGITTEYVLALDADMPVSPEFVEELRDGFLPGGYDGGIVHFVYQVDGQPLRGSLYPPQLRLFRPGQVIASQTGHNHEFTLSGRMYRFRHAIYHDDRKALERWTNSQLTYSRQERDRILRGEGRGWKDRLRRWGLAPLVVGPYAYLKAGGPFGGAGAVRYALERTTFEALLAMRFLRRHEMPGEPGRGATER